jgi:predicted pyridoxine 5'-phosphate oxidase superfamily flavin-nucleotide-binding protein
MAYRDHLITTMEQLQSLYGEKMGASVIKEIDHISDGYRKLIEAAPFVATATRGPGLLAQRRRRGFRTDPRRQDARYTRPAR